MRSLLYALAVLSLPLRGAWIEIDLTAPLLGYAGVAPPAGSVD